MRRWKSASRVGLATPTAAEVKKLRRMADEHNEYEKRAIAAGWFKLRRGWYHVNAWNYWGWYDSPRFYATAEQLCEREDIE